MSRIGREPIILPNEVKVEINNNIVTVIGPLGTMTETLDKNIVASVSQLEGKNVLLFTRKNETDEVKAKHGLYRALVNGMVEGVSKGFTKSLVINGVGFKAQINGNKLVLNIGFSHPVEFEIPSNIKIACPSLTEITITGFNKEQVGQVAANIRTLKPVEPYHAYGIRYKNEVVRRKEGKKASAKKK